MSESESCSDSASHSESGSESVASLRESLILPSKETLSENPKDQTIMGRTSPQVPDQNVLLKDNQILHISVKSEQNSSSSSNNQKTDISSTKCTIDKSQANKTENRSLKILRNFSQKEIMTIWVA